MTLTKTENMKATVKYIYGWVLVIPKYNNSPLLFLEAISQISNHAGKNLIHCIIDNGDGSLNIRLNMKKTEYENICDYINSNN